MTKKIIFGTHGREKFQTQKPQNVDISANNNHSFVNFGIQKTIIVHSDAAFTKAKMCDLWRNEQSCSSICSCSMPKCTSGSFVCTQSTNKRVVKVM